MPKKGNHWESTIKDAYAQLPPGAKAAISDILPQLDADGRQSIDNLAVSLRRKEQQRESNRKTDPKRRTLVGTRMSHAKAARYKRMAAQRGMNLNQWVNWALEYAARAQEAPFLRIN